MASDGEVTEECDRLIPLVDIDPRDERFRITTRRASDDLHLSIGRLGLRVPPLVVPGAAGFIIVSGFRRIAACQGLGWDSIRARVLQKASPYECTLKAIAANSLERPLNLIETSRALRLLDQYAPGGQAPPEHAAALGLPTHAGLAARLKTLCGLPAEVQDAILEETVSFAMACEIGRMEEGLAVDFARLFRQLKTSLNKQREILTLVAEIARREGINPRQVLTEDRLSRLRDAQDLDRNQKTQRIRKLLRQRRFPALVAAEDNFQSLRQRLALGSNLQLVPPRDFEGTRFTLTLNFESVEEVSRLRVKLDELVDHPDFKTLLTGKGRGFGEAPVP
ncbi:MAG: ParB N-terminal domain-containing protein [Deltaproteobacteria bacterium]|nr:ParB N-terminal domain-containing protein [Deltaproteobacteria bacterium]